MSPDITQWLTRWNSGDQRALDELMPLVYHELRRLAAGYLRAERYTHTLQATALVHEAFLQVRSMSDVEWRDRGHFIAFAATAMRRVLVSHARARRAAKRGGEAGIRAAEDPDSVALETGMDVIALDDALNALAKEHPRQAQVVELRFFGGLTSDETAEVLRSQDCDVSVRTVERDWRFARAWLHEAMTSQQ